MRISFGGAPRQVISDCPTVERVGLPISDYPGIRAEPLVSAGAPVARGAPLFRDRRRPEIVVPSPISGIVEAVQFGAKNRLSLVTLRAEGDRVHRVNVPKALDRTVALSLLLTSGLWTSFTARPFGHVPDPGDKPDAIFVTATDTDPNAADPAVVMAGREGLFSKGLALLTHLTEGPVFLCQAEGAALAPQTQRIRVEEFAGPHPAGLAGTHMDRLFPVRAGRTVWQIFYQDVLEIGEVLRDGAISGQRVVALSGPQLRDPRLIRVPDGVDLEAMVATEATQAARQVLSGSALSGRESRFLRRRHWQATILPRRATQSAFPARRSGKALRPAAIIPHAALEQALGVDIPVVPLLRALSIGDSEEADRLGCRALLEEDMALATYLTGGTADFGALLRDTLDKLEKAG